MADRICSVDACEKSTVARGWCTMHYQRWKLTGDPGSAKSKRDADRTCSVDGCTSRAQARGWCDLHYRRWLVHRDPLFKKSTVNDGSCAVDGCDRQAKARGWCLAHYQRWQKSGDPGGSEVRPRIPLTPGQTCSVDGCDREVQAQGWCNAHYKRWMRYGDPDYITPPRIGERNHQWGGDDIGYAGAHDRVVRAKGKAKDFRCVRCGSQAQDWAYDHSDPDERIVPEGLRSAGSPYSLNVDSYIPMCKSCHKKYDAAHARG